MNLHLALWKNKSKCVILVPDLKVGNFFQSALPQCHNVLKKINCFPHIFIYVCFHYFVSLPHTLKSDLYYFDCILISNLLENLFSQYLQLQVLFWFKTFFNHPFFRKKYYRCLSFENSNVTHFHISIHRIKLSYLSLLL